MPQYMLLMYQPADGRPRNAAGEPISSEEEFAEVHQQWQKFTQDLVDAGMLVSNTGLQGAEAATTVRVRGGETQITDGPFAETKELLAGYYLIEAPDLDTALERAARIPSAAYGSVEVRPAWG